MYDGKWARTIVSEFKKSITRDGQLEYLYEEVYMAISVGEPLRACENVFDHLAGLLMHSDAPFNQGLWRELKREIKAWDKDPGRQPGTVKSLSRLALAVRRHFKEYQQRELFA